MKTARPRFFGIAFLILLCCAPALAQQNATVAAWNVKGFEPIPASRIRLIARAIHNMRPDVIALTEVNPDTALDDLVAELRNHGDEYRSLIVPQTARQNIGLLFRNGVDLSGGELIDGSDDGDADLRKALAARVRVGRFDFILITVHMKSARSQQDRATRTRQATAIARFIERQTAGAEKDVLVVGDYNMIPGPDDVNFRALSPGPNSNEFLRYVSTEALVGQASHISSCNPRRGNLLDGYAISRLHTREFRPNSLRLITMTDPVFRQEGGGLPNCATYTGLISDHLPLVARFRVTSDDDGVAPPMPRSGRRRRRR